MSGDGDKDDEWGLHLRRRPGGGFASAFFRIWLLPASRRALPAPFSPSCHRLIVPSSHRGITNPIPADAGARSPDNGLLTPAMKLARPAISKAYEKEIKAS